MAILSGMEIELVIFLGNAIFARQLGNDNGTECQNDLVDTGRGDAILSHEDHRVGKRSPNQRLNPTTASDRGLTADVGQEENRRDHMAKQLVILSGPSCVGKGPLAAAVERFHADIKYAAVPVIKSTESRRGEPRPDDKIVWENSDYWRNADEIMKERKNPRFIVGDCRGFPQAIDLDKVAQSSTDLVFVEAYHTIGRQLIGSKYLKNDQVTTVFLSPFGAQEIGFLRACGLGVATAIRGAMVFKQVNRATFQGKRIDRALLKDIEERANDAIDELRSASDYTFIIVNHDGEGSPNWKRDPAGGFTSEPHGDAKRALSSLTDILLGKSPGNVEHWPHGTV